MDIIKWLENWFTKNCDGDWEHGYGIRINTLDNPGWSVSINLQGTELEDKNFKPVEIDRNDLDWIYCRVEDRTFRGAGGTMNLEELLMVFRQWALSEN